MANELMPHALVCLVALGMALAFLSADRESPTSRALAIALASAALSIDLNIVLPLQFDLSLHVTRWFGWTEAIAMLALLEWILGVRRTVPSRGLNTRPADIALRVGQLAALVYGVFAVLYPEARTEQFLGALDRTDSLHQAGFWLFAVPTLMVALTGAQGIHLLLNRQPDRSERVRLLAMSAAMPFFLASLVMPLHLVPVAIVLAEIIFLIGAVHYHVLQGQRGQFLSRFLSPQVAELVARRGLSQAMEENQLEITVVCCDLRGFTRYAEAHPSDQVLNVLREYYDVVGEQVAQVSGTIKDFAGDGILILIGAPLALAEHAQRGVDLACAIRDAVQARTALWDVDLGIGLGVASGPVTVGVIGSAQRLEYTAVGPAVNLASRLCEQAAAGEILVDARTAELLQAAELDPRPALPLKGFPRPLLHYSVPAV